MKIALMSSNLEKRNTRRVLAGAFGLLLALALIVGLAAPALGVPPQPQPGHGFFGDVTIGGGPAPEFTPVTAEIVGVGSWATEVDDVGQYLITVPYDDLGTPEQDGGLNGDTIDFYVCGAYADSDTFESGATTELDLSIETCGITHTLTMVVVGNGDVTSDLSIDCPDVSCSEEYADGTVVTLTATPDLGSQFLSWSGAGTGDAPGTRSVTMDSHKTVTANFAEQVFAWIDIGAGWRTFSTPIALAPDFNTWGELVALGGLEVEIAYYFDGSSQNWGLVLGDYPVVPCDAIYVKMALAGTVPIVPNPDYTGPPTKELYPDWNLVGLAALNDMVVVEALASVYLVTGDLTGYAQVVSPTINAPDDWVYTRDGGSPLVVIGRGIWVFMINGGTLGGFSSTPLP